MGQQETNQKALKGKLDLRALLRFISGLRRISRRSGRWTVLFCAIR